MTILRRIIPSLLASLAIPCVAQALEPNDSAAWCKNLAPRIPVVTAAQCHALGLAPSGGRSVQSQPIMVLESAERTGTRVLLIGGIHGDELTATAATLRWASWLDKAGAKGIHWRVAPLVNPDGMFKRPPSRTNANGVDLNRNFATPEWAAQAPVWWEKQTRRDPRRFPGKAAGSEPETRWLNEEIERFKPDVIVSVHAPFGILDYDGPPPQPLGPPKNFGRLYLDKLGVYPGSLGNYGGVHKGIPVLTIELPHALKLPNDLELGRIWADMLKWIADYRDVRLAARKTQ
jgi:hypothetical protein